MVDSFNQYKEMVLDHFKSNREDHKELYEDVGDLQQRMAVIDAHVEKCPYDPEKCAQHDKRITVNSTKIALMCAGAGAVGGGAGQLIHYLTEIA